ncbi:MAG: AGE family epimerase/isomerase [Actinomycetota bacterium]|nr:AGE family epimerase/isomerase [Actinomycetota bacterium]
MNPEELKKYRFEVEKEIKTNILPFWTYKTLDKENGGFYGSILNDLTVDPYAAKGSVLCSRILWTFARAFKVFGDKIHLDSADRAYQYLINYFIDNDFGGVYWKVSYGGKPLEMKKQIYAQAFAVYALAEYSHAAGSAEALHLATDIYKLIEKYGFEKKYGGYYDACNRDWSLATDMRLSEGDMNAPKTMNTCLHILEAYTNLLRYWDNRNLRSQLKNLIITIKTHIIDPPAYHFKLFFREDWEKLSDTVSYGHDIEGSWLLVEAAEILDEESFLEDIKKIALGMAETIYKEGVAPDGGLWYEGDLKGVNKFNSDWWPQAEAMVGFLNAYQISPEEHFLQSSLDSWNFVKKYIIDKKYGEWFWSVDKNRNVNQKLEKVGLWKCPYHNARACMEVLERLDHIIGS